MHGLIKVFRVAILVTHFGCSYSYSAPYPSAMSLAAVILHKLCKQYFALFACLLKSAELFRFVISPFLLYVSYCIFL